MYFKLILFLCIGISPALTFAEPLNLTKLVRLAENNSAYLEAKHLQIQATVDTMEQTQLWANPTISTDLGGITQTNISGFSYSLTVSQPVYFPGKRKLRAAFAALARDTEKLTLIERKQLVQFNVVQAAYRYELTHKILELFKSRLGRFRMLRSAVAAKPIVSPEIRAQKFIIENALRNAERDYANLERELIIAAETLRIYVPSDVVENLALPMFDKPLSIARDETLAAALENNVLLRKIAVQNRSAETNAERLAREAYPDLNFDAYYAKDTGPFQEHRFGAGVTLPIPVFNRNQHAVSAAKNYALAANKEREYAALVLKRDAIAAYQDYLVAIEMMKKFPVAEAKATSRNIARLTSEFMRSRLSTLTFANAEQRMTDQIAASYRAQLSYVLALLQIALLEGSDDLTSRFMGAGSDS